MSVTEQETILDQAKMVLEEDTVLSVIIFDKEGSPVFTRISGDNPVLALGMLEIQKALILTPVIDEILAEEDDDDEENPGD